MVSNQEEGAISKEWDQILNSKEREVKTPQGMILTIKVTSKGEDLILEVDHHEEE